MRNTKNAIAVISVGLVAALTMWSVRRFHKPGQLDVISAQAMDMSQMRPPIGASPVALAAVRPGALGDTVTYTGTALPYNEQDISPRIAGTIMSMPLYPGSKVRAGELVAQLDSAEVAARTQQAVQEAREANINTVVAHQTHHLHHTAAMDQANAQLAAASQGVADAQAEAQASQDAIGDADAGVVSAQAGADYWTAQIAREKQLTDAGAESQQAYQDALSKARTADAAVTQAKAKALQARSLARASQARVQTAKRNVEASQAAQRMAWADLTIAKGQAEQAGAASSAAEAAVKQASVVEGYTRIAAPISGIVTARPVAPGTLVQPGTVLLKIAQIDRVRIQANVAVSDLGGIHPGSPIQVEMQDGGKPFSAQVTSVFPSANAETRTAVVEAVVPNPAQRLMPGAFVTMRISKPASQDKLLVPASAILSQGGESFVWTAKNAGSTQIMYECTVCHMRYSAAQAAKNHYRDPMDGGKLIPVKANDAAAFEGVSAHKVMVTAGASDGKLTEVTADDLTAGSKVVAQGSASLVEGARLVTVEWGTNGPKSLPDAAGANVGQTVYRCEKCGMAYSEADAKKNNFIDPMDGGKLIPMKEAGR